MTYRKDNFLSIHINQQNLKIDLPGINHITQGHYIFRHNCAFKIGQNLLKSHNFAMKHQS